MARFYTPKEFLCQNETENAAEPSSSQVVERWPKAFLTPGPSRAKTLSPKLAARPGSVPVLVRSAAVCERLEKFQAEAPTTTKAGHQYQYAPAAALGDGVGP